MAHFSVRAAEIKALAVRYEALTRPIAAAAQTKAEWLPFIHN